MILTRPQLVRDAVGWHLVCGEWMLDCGGRFSWQLAHVRRYAQLGRVQIDRWCWLGLALTRYRQSAGHDPRES